MTQLPPNTALIVIDVQVGFDNPAWGHRNNLEAEANIERLLNAWRSSNRPVFIVQHHSLEPGSPLAADAPGAALKESVLPHAGEALITKNVNSAFIGTDLEEQLQQQGFNPIVIAGLTTDHCISTSARMAGNLGFDTYVISDATATFDRADQCGEVYKAELIHTISLASLHDEFATVLTTDQLLTQLA